MGGRASELSRLVSYALRHAPWELELELDGEGWAPVEQLLEALRGDPAWAALTVEELTEMVRGAGQGRHELDGARIRARYGHSVPVALAREPSAPPALLYHGTSPEALPAIAAGGLEPRARRYVHLAATVERARAVGRRKSAAPVVLVVDAAAAAARGLAFFRATDEIFLTARVPAEFLRRLDGGAL